MMALSPALADEVADHVAALGAWVSLHWSDPGVDGVDEADWGGYARQQTVWAPAVDGATTGSVVVITAPDGEWTHFGIWDAATSGTFLGSGPIEPVTFSIATALRVYPTVRVG